MKRGTPTHPKMAELAKRLHIPLPHAVGIMEMIWHFTAQYAPDGDIGKFPDERIANFVHWGRHRPASVLIDALVATGWLDADPQVQYTVRAPGAHLVSTGCAPRLQVHDWCDHAERSVRDRCATQGISFSKIAGKPAPCLSLAIAKPQPQPTEEPQAAVLRIGELTPAEWAERLYGRHPKKRNRTLVEQVVCSLAANPDKAIAHASVKTASELFALIDRAHEILSATHDWTKDGARYCPKLDEWLTDEGYRAVEVPAANGEVDVQTQLKIWKREYEEEIRSGKMTEEWEGVVT